MSTGSFLMLGRTGRPRIGRIKSSDFVLAFLIVSIIGLMILPLPLPLLDTLVAANIAVGVMLVLMAIYVNSVLEFSAFPSVLLISTLFRLALSVATTRLILLDGDAGHIIETFGQLVAGGNLVVGLVVFLIITLVQFLVIAKGSERVAEVGARFTLDAMPGKQLSIDSDLRSGLIDKTEARKKRADLEMESQLHGSMDGAMKFVKGDAIAGIVVILVNLLGGLAVGVFQVGMSAGDAMAKYSILTIGDGLVAQIPALFGAMAAGLIVTRVSGANNEEHLGASIGKQFAAIPKVSLVAGLMCLLFAFVPGFPTSIFIGLGIALVFVGAMLVPAFRVFMNAYSTPAFNTVLRRKEHVSTSHVNETDSVTPRQSYPLSIELPIRAATHGGDILIQDTLQSLLQSHYERSGIALPVIHFNWHQRDSQRWTLSAFDVPIVSGELSHTPNHNELGEQCLQAIRRNISLFMGIQEASQLLNQVALHAPEVVKEVQRVVPIQGISIILRNLVKEEVPLRNLIAVLESLIESGQNEKDLGNLTEYARIALGRQTCNAYARDGVLRAIGLSLRLEETLLGSVRASGGSSDLDVDPMLQDAIRERLVSTLGNYQDDAVPTVVFVPVLLRQFTRNLLIEAAFDTPVLSYPELTRPFQMNLVERIDVDLNANVEQLSPRSAEA